MTRYRIEVVQTRRGMLDIEPEPDETPEALRQRAREVVEDGDAEPNWFDIEYATERCYDADAECQPRKGEPVPCTLAGVRSLKLGLVMDIITAWISAQTEPDPTSPPPSGGGGMEALTPMTPLTGSPGS